MKETNDTELKKTGLKFCQIDREVMIKAVYCTVIAAALLLICTRSSFLFAYNNWDDANSYFSVGKGIFNGKVPYRDIFDQKGMYLYFLYGLAYLWSHTTFAGVFLIEIILASFANYAVLRILQLYLKKSISYLLLPFTMAFVYSSFSFYWGGSAEEFMLPFLAWGLYFSIYHFKKTYPETMPYKIVLINGMLAGVIANIKFNSLGFFFAFMMMVFFSEIIQKKFRQAFVSCFLFLGGMLLMTVPWILYFTYNGALFSWYEGYLYYNIFLYSNLSGEGPTVFERIYTLSKLLYLIVIDNIQYFAFIILGFIGVVFSRKTKVIEKINLISLVVFLFLGVYIGGVVLPYYSLVLSVFTVLGFIVVGHAIQWIMKNREINKLYNIVALAVSLCLVFLLSMNREYLSDTKDSVFLTQFKEIISETDKPTLLNCGCLDAGLYTVCNIVPNCRWFQTQTLPISLVKDEQNRYIREERIDYVLVRGEKPTELDAHYELVAQKEQKINDEIFTYYLYKKRE